jgi:hypothetical protein
VRGRTIAGAASFRTILFGGLEGSTAFNFKAGTGIFDLNTATWKSVAAGQ